MFPNSKSMVIAVRRITVFFPISVHKILFFSCFAVPKLLGNILKKYLNTEA